MSCNTPSTKDEEEPLQSPCINSTEFHFAGYINDQVKCFSAGTQTYQRYSGGGIESDEAPVGVFTMGINTWPLQNGDEAIFINTPKVNTKDINDIRAKLPIGTLTLEQRKDFYVWYSVIKDVAEIHNMRTTTLRSRFDEDSYIHINSVEIEDNPLFNGTNLKVSMTFGCKLYDGDWNLVGSIESADFTGRLYIRDGGTNN